MAGTVRVFLFAGARQAVGRGELDWPVPSGGLSALDLVHQLVDRFPRLKPVAAISRLVRNDEYVASSSVRVRPGDEFAIHPPYSGG